MAGLTTGAVARRIGVSPTTLRSWDRRYGLGPARRPQGSHRRWGPQDLAVVEEMCRLTAAGAPPAEAARVARASSRDGLLPDATTTASHRRPDGAEGAPPAPGRGAGGGLPLGEVRQECRGLSRAALRLDAPELERRLLDAVRQFGLVTAWEEVMVPTLRAVGRKWEASGDRYVEVEHLLSWHVSTALRRAELVVEPRAVPRSADAPVVLACAPGEQHCLPLEALQAALSLAGVPTRMLGSAVPADALLACIGRTGPAAVVLWAQSRSAASAPLAHHVATLRWGQAGARRRPLVLPAGPGWDRRAAGAFAQCTGLADAVMTLRGLYGDERTAGPGESGGS